DSPCGTIVTPTASLTVCSNSSIGGLITVSGSPVPSKRCLHERPNSRTASTSHPGTSSAITCSYPCEADSQYRHSAGPTNATTIEHMNESERVYVNNRADPTHRIQITARQNVERSLTNNSPEQWHSESPHESYTTDK